MDYSCNTHSPPPTSHSSLSFAFLQISSWCSFARECTLVDNNQHRVRQFVRTISKVKCSADRISRSKTVTRLRLEQLETLILMDPYALFRTKFRFVYQDQQSLKVGLILTIFTGGGSIFTLSTGKIPEGGKTTVAFFQRVFCSHRACTRWTSTTSAKPQDPIPTPRRILKIITIIGQAKVSVIITAFIYSTVEIVPRWG